jgi:hypothetical protein
MPQSVQFHVLYSTAFRTSTICMLLSELCIFPPKWQSAHSLSDDLCTSICTFYPFFNATKELRWLENQCLNDLSYMNCIKWILFITFRMYIDVLSTRYVWLCKMTLSLWHVLIKTDFEKLPYCHSSGHITFPIQTPQLSSSSILSGVRLSSLGNAATTGLMYQPQMIEDGDCGAISGIKIGRGNQSTRRQPAPAPICPSQIPGDHTRAQIQVTAMGRDTNHMSYYHN